MAKESASLTSDEQLSSGLQEKKKELRSATEELERKLEEERSRLFVTMSSLTEARNRILELERIERERQVREERRIRRREKAARKTGSSGGERVGVKEPGGP